LVVGFAIVITSSVKPTPGRKVMSPELRKEYREQRFPPPLTRILMDDADIVLPCMSSEHFGQLAWQFKRMSGSSGLKVQAAIAC
jgi:hypothetical protein